MQLTAVDLQLGLIKRQTVRLLDCVRARDVAGIAECYAHDAVYSDPVLGDLHPGQARLIWPLKLAHMRRMQLSYVIDDISLLSARVSSRVAYDFFPTGRSVQMRLHTLLVFRGGLIVRHDDEFDLASWRRMALGPSERLGTLLPSWRRRVRQATDALLSRTAHGLNG
jgi:hypothetical protein